MSKRKQTDITDGWKLIARADGTYDARFKADIRHTRLGNGRTEISAWVELRDILSDKQEDPRDEAIHRALSYLQKIVDDEPHSIGEADRVMEVLRNAICPLCASGKPHTREQPHL